MIKTGNVINFTPESIKAGVKNPESVRLGEQRIWPICYTTEIAVDIDPEKWLNEPYGVIGMQGEGYYDINWGDLDGGGNPVWSGPTWFSSRGTGQGDPNGDCWYPEITIPSPMDSWNAGYYYLWHHWGNSLSRTNFFYKKIPGHTYTTSGVRTVIIRATAGIKNINFDTYKNELTGQGIGEKGRTVKLIRRIASTTIKSLARFMRCQGCDYYNTNNSPVPNLNYTNTIEFLNGTNFVCEAPYVLDWDEAFKCAGVNLIPTNFFGPIGYRYNAGEKDNLSYMFSGNYGIKSIPENLLANHRGGAELMFECTGITIPPAALLQNMDACHTVRGIFRSCWDLTTIPEGFFGTAARPLGKEWHTSEKLNIGVWRVGQEMANCPKLTSVPNDMFRYLGLFTDPSISAANRQSFDGTFTGCTALTKDINDIFQSQYPGINALGITTPNGEGPETIFVSVPPIFGATAGYNYDTGAEVQYLGAAKVVGSISQFLSKFPNLITPTYKNPKTNNTTCRAFYKCLNTSAAGLTSAQIENYTTE